MKLVICASLLVFFVFNSAQSDDVIGCGGFIKSDVEIDTSHIQVKLFTKSGILKYETNCAPNSGYYMFPVYDKGDYLLKVESQYGWRFEPEALELSINGEDDPCSRSEDINFQFAGFSIKGNVISKGEKSGPADVVIQLQKTGSSDALMETKSKAGGHFSFEKVMPGSYVVVASHPSLVLEKNKATADITKESVDIGSVFTVSGYDVTGQIYGDGEPVKGVNFILLSSTKINWALPQCDKASTKDLTGVDGLEAVCQVKSDDKGRFVFKAVPCGKYVLVPFYKGDNIKFDVVPGKIELTVDHASVSVKDTFQVAGFTVTGVVQSTKGGKGVGGARVSVGDKQAVSSDSGSYLLDSVKAGTYVVKVEAPDMMFDGVEVKISPSSPKIPPIVASKFSVCGKIDIEQKIDDVPDLLTHKISVLKSDGQKYDTVNTKPDGGFCVYCHPGKYSFKVELAEPMLKAGVKLVPDKQDVVVTAQPLNNIRFSQFYATVSGSVHCIESCGVMQLTLTELDRSNSKKFLQFNENGKKISYSFADVAPGKYKVSVSESTWCWDSTEREFEVITSNVQNVDFKQSGYSISYVSSHDVSVKLLGKTNELISTLSMKSGQNKFCVEKPGVYSLQPETCLTYDQQSFSFNTAEPEVVQLQAVGRVVEGLVITSQKVSDINVHIKSSLNPDQPQVLQLQKPESPKDKTQATFHYKFSYNAKNGEKLSLKASSGLLLFHPKNTDITVTLGSCPGDTVKFEGRMGYFVEGQVHPSLEGVLIQVYIGENETPLAEALTNINGSYKVGPLEGKADYKMKATKDGFSFTEVQGQSGHFTSFQLSQVIVEVVDESDVQLSGVLLALSGSNSYRNNSISQPDQSTAFSQLLPGKYFLKAMMKEYQFHPAAEMIELESGAKVNMKMRGKRISFSCLGTVESLNGEAEAGVRIDAVGLNECKHLQEESNTNPDGSFRIRGLKPGCEYSVSPKSDNGQEQRSIPKSWTVKMEESDYSGVKFLSIRSPQQMDLSGIIHTSTDSFLDSLKVDLYRLTPTESLLSSTSLDKTCFFYPPSVPMDGQEYLLKLTSSLSTSMYEFSSTEIHFIANTSYKHFTLKFEPKRKSFDQDGSRDSVIVMPIALLLLALAYNYNQILPFLQSSGLLNAVSKVPVFQSVVKPQQQSPDISSAGDFSLTSDAAKKKQKSKKI